MAYSNVKWKGMKAMDVLLDTLPNKLGGSVLRQAYNYSLEPTKQAMISNVPPDKTGNLRRSIDTTVVGSQKMEEMKGVIGPRRKKYTWNMQGWHAHIVEKGTKPHTIRSKNGTPMPVYKNGKLLGVFDAIQHPGSRGTYPFKRAIDGTWREVGKRLSDKVSLMMEVEIKKIQSQYGNVVTKNDL